MAFYTAADRESARLKTQCLWSETQRKYGVRRLRRRFEKAPATMAPPRGEPKDESALHRSVVRERGFTLVIRRGVVATARESGVVAAALQKMRRPDLCRMPRATPQDHAPPHRRTLKACGESRKSM